MSKITFSTKEIKIIQKNPNVQRVSSLAITFTDDFKNKFMNEYQEGKLPRRIFEENGFDINILGVKRIEQSAYRWKKAYEKDGLIGLSDARKTASGRSLKRELSQAEIIERQDGRIKLLEGQVELLKKLETIEKKLLNPSQNLETSTIFQLIFEIIEQNHYKQMAKYFCELLGVSRSEYYNYLKVADS